MSYWHYRRGGGNRDIDCHGSTGRGKEDKDEGESGHEEGMKEARARRNNRGSETSGLKKGGNSGSESGDGAGADKERHKSGDEEERKDWCVCGVDGDTDSDRREGSVCKCSESDEVGEGAEGISDGLARSNDARKGKGRKRKRSNSVAENVFSGSVTTSKSTRGRVRTPNMRMRDL